MVSFAPLGKRRTEWGGGGDTRKQVGHGGPGCQHLQIHPIALRGLGGWVGVPL